MNAEPVIADGMPKLGETSKARLEQLVTTRGPDIVASCPGATKLAIEKGSGRVWDGVNGGEFRVVHTENDYRFVVTVAAAIDIPRMPVTYDGVPVHFALSDAP